jgi:NO-binding membrane sensor protein with MHYT domain
MCRSGPPLLGLYNYRLVVFSMFIAISSSHAALDFGGPVTPHAAGSARVHWLRHEPYEF